MSLNESLQGKVYESVPFVVEEERVRAFADAVAHRGDDVPPTFATAPDLQAGLTNVTSDPDLGLALSAVLHGEQEYEWMRPLRVGERLTAQATIERIRGRGAMRFLVLRTVLRDEAGETVVVGRCKLIVREDP